MSPFDLRQHWRDLDTSQKARFVRLSGTTRSYLDNHVLHRRKFPRPGLIKKLAAACRATGAKGASEAALLLWFYGKATAPASRGRAASMRASA